MVDLCPARLKARLDLGLHRQRASSQRPGGHATLLAEMVRNLLDNAIALHARETHHAQVMSDRCFSGVLVLLVEDSGPAFQSQSANWCFNPTALGTNVDGSGLAWPRAGNRHSARRSRHPSRRRFHAQRGHWHGPGTRIKVRFASMV
jgi:two-component system sensor histidine kinase TctE